MTSTQLSQAAPQESAPPAPPRSRRLPWWAAALALVLAVAVGAGIGWRFFFSHSRKNRRDSVVSILTAPRAWMISPSRLRPPSIDSWIRSALWLR